MGRNTIIGIIVAIIAIIVIYFVFVDTGPAVVETDGEVVEPEVETE